MNIPDYIKPGAFCRLRDGSKVEIYSTDNGGDYPIHGRAFCQSSGKAYTETWTNEGWALIDEPDFPRNIIGPWVEQPDYSKLWPILPPWIKWLARDASGRLFGYTSKPERSHNTWGNGGAYLSVPPEYCPEPIGDWEDSLQERPTP